MKNHIMILYNFMLLIIKPIDNMFKLNQVTLILYKQLLSYYKHLPHCKYEINFYLMIFLKIFKLKFLPF